MKAILTSTGFDNENIMQIFLNMLNKSIDDIKVLFVPAALTEQQQRDYAQCFLDDLLKAGIQNKNIDTYVLNEVMDTEKAKEYDVMYFSGGDPNLLMGKILAMGFKESINEFLNNDGIYFGASAGSDIMTNSVESSLGYLNITLICHDNIGCDTGELNTEGNPTVKLNDNQAIIVDCEKIFVAE